VLRSVVAFLASRKQNFASIGLVLKMTVTQLGELAEVQAGYPFRGSVPYVQGGNAFALQMRDLAPDGLVNWSGLVQTDVDEGKGGAQWLVPGDIVFVARGGRNYAVCLTEVPLPAVCSQYFFLLRLERRDVLPEFLSWQINQLPAQRYFAKTAEGSDQLSIRRGVLEQLQVAIPPLEEQQRFVDLAATALKEKRVLEAMIRNRQQQLDALAIDLASN